MALEIQVLTYIYQHYTIAAWQRNISVICFQTKSKAHSIVTMEYDFLYSTVKTWGKWWKYLVFKKNPSQYSLL
jgi:hypothetical protein